MATAKWQLDPTHSSIDFSIGHLMISKVKGTFRQFKAEIEADPDDLTTAKINLTVDVASIDTRNDDRDNHLRSADFFDVEKYPKMTFQSTEIVRKNEREYDVTGNLTLHGVTRPVTFSVTSPGVVKDPWGNQVAAFSAHGQLKRSDFGLTWNNTLETGGVLVSDEVEISVQIEAKKEG